MPLIDSNLLTEQAQPSVSVGTGEPDSDEAQSLLSRDILNRVTTRDLCGFTRQLSALLRAGLPLVPALRALGEQFRDTHRTRSGRSSSSGARLADIVERVTNDVTAGSSLAGALAKHPRVFSALYVNMVAAGQVGGNLEEILHRLAQMLERRVRLAGKVKAAMAYPLMMLVVAVAVVVFLLSFVVPGITEIFVEMNRDLPWVTKLLIGVSSFLRSYLMLISLIIGAAMVGLMVACRDQRRKMAIDRYKLKLPLFGKLITKLETARLTRTLGTLVKSGVPILEALNIARGVMQNSFMANSLKSIADSVGKGDNIAEATRRTGLFAPVVYHVIATSQASGDIEDGLLDLADMYDEEVEVTARTLTSLLEPAIMLTMGLVVGFIVLAILLPIFEINQVM